VALFLSRQVALFLSRQVALFSIQKATGWPNKMPHPAQLDSCLGTRSQWFISTPLNLCNWGDSATHE
jgi:hypothetical protein